MDQLDADLLRIGKSTEMINVRSVTYRFKSCPDYRKRDYVNIVMDTILGVNHTSLNKDPHQ